MKRCLECKITGRLLTGGPSKKFMKIWTKMTSGLNLMSTKLRLIILLTHSLEANSFEQQFLYEVKSHKYFKNLQLLTS